MNAKRILSIVLTVALLLSVFGITTYAEGEKAKIYIADTTAYEVVRDETKIYVPIMVDGSIDMQCYDITITYDKSVLEIVADETYIVLPDGKYTYPVVNTGTAGTVRFAGMTTEEAAKTKTGEIGQIVFTCSKRIKDGITADLGLSVAELGFGTEVADIEVDKDAVVTVNESANPNTPAPSVTLGDVNADTKINATDALAVLRHAAKIEELKGDSLTAADVTKDTKADAMDALQILRYAAQIIDSFE